MILSEKFNLQNFTDWIEKFLPELLLDLRKVDVPNGLSDVKSIQTLGESNIGVRIFVIETERDPSGRKIGLAKESFNIIKNYGTPNALIAYYSEDSSKWRLSLLTSTAEWSEGKIITKLSNPKRQSYVLGPHSKVSTPTRFLLKKDAATDIADLKSRFSLEVVNKEFYKEISESFIKLIGGTQGTGRNQKKYDAVLKLPSIADHSQTSIEFAVRLIGRIIFCWFLREKKSSDSTSLMPKELVSLEAINNHSDYYHQVLEPIFFEVLNQQVKARKDPFYNKPYSLIPYLNGGLFSPHEDDFYKRNNSDFQSQFHNTLIIPDEWFVELFKTLETYNFTIDENTSFDEELSIDPEMLGRIFENLLAEINPETGESARKSTGSYYTPRVIVDYMIDESLLLYLKQQTEIEEGKLRAIISYDLTDDTKHPLNENEKQKAIDALEKIKILDPACGSGAFPIGALQKMVFILQQIDPDGQSWFRKQLENADPEFRRDIERRFTAREYDYIRKLGLIRKCIYGVDIQPIATEISRLRCFLTLIVDQNVNDELENRGIRSLPNLEFKFVTANTLISLPKREQHQQSLIDDYDQIDELKAIRDLYFDSTGAEREMHKANFYNKQTKIFKDLRRQHGWVGLTKATLTDKLTDWDPFSHKASDWFDSEWMFGIKEGFDIVIANPPYIRQEGIDNKQAIHDHFISVFDGRADIYTYFIKKGFDLLSPQGILAYITSNKYLVRGYGIKIRKFLSNKSTISQLINFGELPVFQASVDSTIIICTNSKSTPESKFLFSQAKTIEHINDVHQLIFENGILQDASELNKDVWLFNDKKKTMLLDKIKKDKQCLDNVVNIFGGIKTGFDEAFIIDESTKGELIKEDANVRRLIRPWFKGRDIKKWSAKTSHYVIYIPHNKVNISDFPSIEKHLFVYKEKLEKRATNQKWFELQQPQERFTELFDNTKIIYSEIAKEMRAFKDESRSYGTMKMFFIPYNSVILGILNSDLFDWYSRMSFSSLGDPWNGGRMEFKTMYMSKVPIPELNGRLQNEIGIIVEEINRDGESVMRNEKLNNAIYKLYDLTDDEINIIKSQKYD